jgi:uncharacterized membrane protein YgdD (TMEM256/DUF423 family)
MERTFFIIGAVSAGLAVLAGAFGAHGLKDTLGAALGTYEKAVWYQMVHALAMFAVVLALGRWPLSSRMLNTAGWLFLAGSILFSGSLYLLSLTGIRWLGAITPLGGVAFALGWLLLALGAWKG